MTALRQSAIMELEKIPEDKLAFIIQIMQGVNGLYNDSNKERKETFARLEQLRKKGTVTECAKSYGAEYIVTRNVSDYSVSDIKAILPSEYLGL